jgi:3-deoxy-D-manno-octulosonic-acid transferase
MYAAYSVLLFISLMVYLPVYWIRARFIRQEPLYLQERLGLALPQVPNARPAVWLHAVSVGEVLSLQNLCRRLKSDHPEWAVYVSALTASGLRMAREKLSAVDAVFCIPLDLPWIVRRLFKVVHPRIFVLVESELWPNLLREAGRTAEGTLIINGRISLRTARRYRRLKSLVQRVLAPIDAFQVQTPIDRDRLCRIGIEPERIQVAGNLKAEIRLPPLGPDEVRSQKLALGIPAAASVVVAGSTHKGEEVPLLRAFAAARRERPDLRLILAPRHLDRVPEIMMQGESLDLVLRRRQDAGPEDSWDVLVLDTIGELARLYGLADAAFIGGSLIAWGGQNLLEPAFYGKPIYFGPYMDNFAHLAEIFLEADAARLIKGQDDLISMFLMEGGDELRRMGDRAKATLESLRGATDKALRAIEERMLEPEGSSIPTVGNQ